MIRGSSRSNRLAALSLLVVSLGGAGDSTAFAGDEAKLESKYYLVQTGLPADRTKEIGRLMDATGAEYHRRFQGFRGVVRQKPLVRVFATKEEYVAELRKTLYGGQPEHFGGLFNPTDLTVYTYDHEGMEAMLRHECFHQFVHQAVDGELPVWANEGLAVYFQDGVFDAKGGRLQLGAAPPGRLKLLRQAREAGQWIPVDRLLQRTADEWHDAMGTPFGDIQYAQAWLLCHFLIHGDGGKYQNLFDRYLRQIDQGLDGITAFKRVFGDDVPGLQKRLDAYFESLAREP